ncbi:metallophosphoesterase [Streptomyces sp. NPDC057702]|uniref:metallophosphoesterase n=1 Tax=unclassified Streptomyces TaxID=2593676 RepID=UPI00369E9A0C
MVAVFALVALLIVALLGGVHWYVWRRMVRDVTAAGGWPRRIGTWAVVALPLLSVGALVSGRAGAPFTVQRLLAWPGYMWLAVLLYLTLALIVGEAVRPLLTRALERRARRADRATAAPRIPGSTAVTSAEAAPTASAPPVAGTPTPPLVPHGPSTATTAPAAAPAPNGPSTATAPDATPVGPDPDPDTSPGPDSADPGPGTTSSPDPVPDVASAPAAVTSRRLFVARGVAVGAGAVAAATVGYGTYGVLRGPRVKRVTVPLAKLSRRAHGYRIAVVSDIHLGPILGRSHTQRIVETINRVNPDLVAVVGDLVDGTVADLGPAAEPLRHLRARDGSFFVTGNHEYFSGADAWVDHVRELGLRPMENERTELPGFDLAGVNDIAGEDEGKGPDFARALGDRDRSRAAVLLAHQPVVIHDAVRHGVDLQLSGHTHGGQLWPGNYLAELANPTVAGLERYGDTQLYVSRGAGAWGPPVRVGAQSDITVVQLASPHA